MNSQYKMAQMYYDSKMYDVALDLAKKLLKKDFDKVKTFLLLADIYKSLNKQKKAIKYYKKALKKDENIYTYNSLAQSYNINGNFKLAKDTLKKSINRFKSDIEYKKEISTICNNVAIIENKLSNIDEAISYAFMAISIDKEFIEAYITLGRSYWLKKDIRHAKTYLKMYLNKNPNDIDVGFSYATLLLASGEYREGFKYYEYRLKQKLKEHSTHNLLPYDIYQKFDDLKKHNLVIYQEQGYGDNIQFVRYLNNLDKKFNISFLVHKSLYKLFKLNFKDINIIQSIESDKKFDYKLPLLSIPYKFNKYFVESKPYLNVKKKDTKLFKKENIKKDKLNIGIVWNSSQESQYNIRRVLKLEDLKKLFDIKDTEFYSLQVDAKEELEKYPNIIDLGKSFNNFYDTAVAISSLDVVISIDTSVAHLAGALGKKTIVLHHHDIIDFRWITENNKSIWYDTIDIINYNDISKIIKRISNKLIELKK
ncbi:MAG: hypothetical protein U9Q30_06475 [Campylobacterota bacterium]|nr:hypothetical protein [Campylobacterota bacterium]